MMKTLTKIFLALLMTTTTWAQERQRFEVETQSGYEYNYFKSPRQVRQGTVVLTEADLIASSSYQDILMDYDYRYKWDRNRIRLSVSPFARLFQENFEDSYWSVLATAKYDYNLSRNTEFLAEIVFKRMNREGLDGAQDVLINPLGYTVYGASSGLKFELFPKNETVLEAFYNFKDFDAFGVRDLQYNEFGVKFGLQQEFRHNGLEHKYGITGYAKKRLYDTFNASDVTTDGERDWNYMKVTGFYTYPVSETFELKPSFVYYTRTDVLVGRSGFDQLGPGLGLKFDDDRTRFRANISYLTRNYTDFEARDTNGPLGEKIRYTYANISLNASHKLGNGGFSLTATAYSRVRATNYTDIDARSFRGYRNQYVGLGIKWEL